MRARGAGLGSRRIAWGRLAAAAAVMTTAAALRLLRAGLRWDEIALAYAAYQQPWLDAWGAALGGEGGAGAVLGTFVGLHPPLYSALYGAVGWAWGAPAGWLLLSAGLSLAAVWVVGRRFGWLAAGVLAVDPLQLAYCAEINNYPLLCWMTALCLAGRDRAASGGGHGAMAAAGIAAGWTHLLGGVVGGLCALSLLRRDPLAALSVLAAMALGCAPVIARGLTLSGDEGTYGQAGLDWGALGQGLWTAQGSWSVIWALAAAGALLGRRPGAAWALIGGAGAVLLMVGLGVAAAHQYPYWLILGPPAAVGLAALARRAPSGSGGRWPQVAGQLVALAVIVGGLAGARPELDRLRQLNQNLQRPRAVDSALAMSAPGDAIWLLAPALQPDDDKTATSDVLWRFSPLGPAPPWRGPGTAPAFEFTDYGFGQPRWMGGRVVHTTTDIWPPQHDAALGWHLAAGRRVWFALYDHSPARDYEGKLSRALSPYAHRCFGVGDDVGLGRDVLCEVTGLAVD